ncbi:MAG: Hpt domain-containing protein [Alphaproteobacteria bacterium]|nr:Hpt domain-containing protein [Alphaproteobacteria bacterium]
MVDTKKTAEEIVRRLRAEFLDDVRDRISNMNVALAEIHDGQQDGEALYSIRREVHSIKGMAGAFDFPSLGIVAHRMEDFMGSGQMNGTLKVSDIQEFIDAMARVIDSGQDIAEADLIPFLRSLPQDRDFIPDNMEVLDAEVLLVASSRMVGRAVGLELKNCGFRPVLISNPFHALETAARTKPDAVVVQAVLDGVSGVEMLRCIHTLQATSDVAKVILTSFGKDDPALAGLPENTHIIRLGPHLADDLGDLLSTLPLDKPAARKGA